MNVLYRKYRAKNFKGLIGESSVTITLKNALKSDNLSHAYMFTGPRGTGKTSTARILAKAVNCLNLKEDGEPCNKCKICTDIDKGIWVDLIEIDAASNRGVDEIRTLKENIGFLPSEGKYRVYIIDEVHMLTKEAFNALLKTLEEPPDHVIFILATTEINKVPVTVLSRCQRFDFYPGTEEDISKVLKTISKKEEIEVPEDIIALISQYSGGSFRDAISMLQKCITLIYDGANNDSIINILGLNGAIYATQIINNLYKKDSKKSLDLVNEYIVKGGDIFKLNELILKLLREILLEGRSVSKTIEFIKLFIEAEKNFKFSPVTQLPVELAIVQAGGEDKKIKEESKKDQESKPLSNHLEANNITNLTLEDINPIWDDLIRSMKSHNHHITAFLSKCNFSIKDSYILIEVPFEFYKERLEESKSRTYIQDNLAKLLGKKVDIKFKVIKGVKPFNKKVLIYDKLEESVKESKGNNIDDIIAAFN